MSGYTTIPYTIAFANELVTDPLRFEAHGYEVRLTYSDPRPGDWVRGVLRARVRDLHDKPPEVRGSERMRKLNTRRQWRCMRKLLCQVCGQPARDQTARRVPWLLTKTVFERTGLTSGRTNAPPCCWDCIPKALEQCQMLQKDFSLYTVAAATSVGVLGDLYDPDPFGLPTLAKHNVFVAWDAHRYHPSCLAVAQVVELHGMKRVP